MILFIIIGIALIGLGIFLHFQQKKLGEKANLMQDTETSTVDSVKDTMKEMSSFGTGNFSLYVEMKGTVRSSHPLIGTFSRQPCVYYKTQVTRKYEVLEEKRDSEGRFRKTWVTKEDVVSSNEDKVEFELEDSTGKILVNLDGAKIEANKVFDTFEQGSRSSRFTDLVFYDRSDSKTIGFQYTEYAIPVNSTIYTLGDANDRSGTLKLSRPQDNTRKFIVSTKSEEQLVAEAKSGAKMAKYGSIASFIGGVLVILYGVLKK